MIVKEYMPLDKIRENILSKYDYKIYDIIPIKFKDTIKQRAVYKFQSDSGPKCLKKVYYDEGNLLFVYSVIEWFYRSGIKVPRLLPAKSGKRYVEYNNDLFIVTDWIDGRRCDYDTDSDIRSAAENLGKMHLCSYNFTPIKGSAARKDESDWHRTFNRRFLQLLQFSNKAFNYNDRVSHIFLNSFEYFYERAKHSVYILNSINASELMEPKNKYNTICHLDYVNKNLIFTESYGIYVIDFDKSKIDIPIHDIGTFLKRILKRKSTSWDFDVLTMSLESYEKHRTLSLVELLGLFAYLEFPQKYWKISRDYFNNRTDCNKKLFSTLLTRTCEQKKDHEIFCAKFQSYIENRFNISLK
jgi:CotS family spore coat protein